MQFADNAVPVQPAYMCMLIRAFIVRLQNQWILQYISTNKECPDHVVYGPFPHGMHQLFGYITFSHDYFSPWYASFVLGTSLFPMVHIICLGTLLFPMVRIIGLGTLLLPRVCIICLGTLLFPVVCIICLGILLFPICLGTRVLTRILKVGVRDSLFVKSRSSSQKVGVPLPQNRSPIFFYFFLWLSFDTEHVPGNFILLW